MGVNGAEGEHQIPLGRVGPSLGRERYIPHPAGVFQDSPSHQLNRRALRTAFDHR